jgi:lipopolysaccharide/colanic/teichoic acid biosynthesis glycosyltransferase
MGRFDLWEVFMTRQPYNEFYKELMVEDTFPMADLSDKKMFFFIKRIMDLSLAFVGLIIALPIMGITMILISLESKGSPIYTQIRVGKDGEEFRVYKLRSMVDNAEKFGPVWASEGDSRITRIGKVIRKYRIDELPQLVNVLMGKMSIVGPRPERPSFTEEFELTCPGFKKRLQVKPGLTGLAQINGGYKLQPSQKIVFDIAYIENLSLKNEIIICWKTIAVIIQGEGAL